jgi:APA family basic amino acid/polyamine antiporter
MQPGNSLQKKLGFWAATAVVIGSVIGSGLFMKPASMAAELGSPTWLMLAWVFGGIFSLFGALVFAEVGAMIPENGGLYAYFRHMFGDFFAFLYGWAAFAVINTASVAAIAFVCIQYADFFLHLPRFDAATEQHIIWHIPMLGDLHPLENFGVKSLGVILVMGLTFLNYLSVKAGSAFQVISTSLKIAVIVALIAGIFFSGNGSVQHFVQAADPKQGWPLITGMVVAMTGAFFAYDGWINVASMAGEIKDPQKNIPRSLITGVFACIIVYVLVNQAYLYALPVEKIAVSPLVASDAIAVSWGHTGAALIAAMIIICTIGAVNGNIMACCRITYQMGNDKACTSWTGKVHPRYQTPGNALWLHAIWTSVFIITGSFDMLADMFVFVTWVAYLFGAIGIFVLRKKMPYATRPYKVWGYPFVPIVFIAFSAFYLVVTIWNDVQNYLSGKAAVINSLLGLVITALGIPLYFYYRKKYKGFTQSR